MLLRQGDQISRQDECKEMLETRESDLGDHLVLYQSGSSWWHFEQRSLVTGGRVGGEEDG